MIRIDIYAYGSGWRVRAHEHSGGADEACDEYCEEETVERAYGQRGESPRDHRDRINAALALALGCWSNHGFLTALTTREKLF